MIRATGRYRNKAVELDRPLNLEDGTRVVIDVSPDAGAAESDWSEVGMSRLEEEWDNPGDAIYDDWRALYGVQPR